MGNSVKISEQIEQYITFSMDAEAKSIFEQQLLVDEELQQSVESYREALSVLRRDWVEESIASIKWKLFIKKVVIGILALAAILGAMFGFLDGEKNTQNTSNIESKLLNQTIVDSTVNQVDYKVQKLDQVQLVKRAYFGIGKPIEDIDSFDVVENNSIQESYFNLSTSDSVAWQNFSIDNTKDTSIVLLGGTQLTFEANTLVTKDNKGSLKDVHLSIREFSSYYDLWCHDLHTCSDKQQLISGGSLFVKATSNNQEVLVKEGESFNIQFPSKFDNDMTIFYGKRNDSGVFNWTKPTKLKEVSPSKPAKRRLFRKDNIVLKYDTIWYLESEVMDEGKMHEKYTFNTLKNTSCFDSTFNTLCKSDKLNVKRMFIKKQNLNLRFHLNPDGKFDRYDYNFILDKRSTKYVKKNAQAVVDNERVFLNDSSFLERIVNVTLIPKFRIETTAVNYSDSGLNESDAGSKKSVLNNLVSSNFGYINCDKFTIWKDKIDMIIKFDLDGLSDVKVFFKDYNSVMVGSMGRSTYGLTNIIRNQRILIIGISKDGKTMSINDTLTADKVICTDQQPYNLLKIKETLESIIEEVEL